MDPLGRKNHSAVASLIHSSRYGDHKSQQQRGTVPLQKSAVGDHNPCRPQRLVLRTSLLFRRLLFRLSFFAAVASTILSFPTLLEGL
jgi:hypothetical protein